MERAMNEAFDDDLTLHDTVKPVLILCYDLRNFVPLIFFRVDTLENKNFNFWSWEVGPPPLLSAPLSRPSPATRPPSPSRCSSPRSSPPPPRELLFPSVRATQSRRRQGRPPPSHVGSDHESNMMARVAPSFGILLLELLTGRKLLDKSRPVREQMLADWAAPLFTHKKKVLGIIDPRLSGDYPDKSVQKIAMLAHHCLNRNSKARPLMRDIVYSLEPL
ncbi:hypothetical protein Cni_G02403 [Canna indica]|uniref:Uncharacterized protein n=1 Tax=Canna indica TaxID=4628 RepID=A0AAQ3JQX3_9LILI|nr:hypothetical protein Cni_G02403 [Canna indica]